MVHERRHILLSLCLCLLLVGCWEGDDWQTKDIAGLMPPLRFTLTQDSGTEVQATDFRGYITLLYFGYTHCPDVCPTTLAKLNAAIARLAPARDVRVLFVSVDPKRDGLDRLRTYTAAFGPQFVGLRGNDEALSELTKRYRITYGYGKPDDDGDYEVSHSSAVFVFDRAGEARLMVRSSDGVDAIAADLKRLDAEEA